MTADGPRMREHILTRARLHVRDLDVVGELMLSQVSFSPEARTFQ